MHYFSLSRQQGPVFISPTHSQPGYFSMLALSLGCSVTAFEPQQRLWPSIARSLQFNSFNLNRFSLLPCALAAESPGPNECYVERDHSHWAEWSLSKISQVRYQLIQNDGTHARLLPKLCCIVYILPDATPLSATALLPLMPYMSFHIQDSESASGFPRHRTCVPVTSIDSIVKQARARTNTAA
jgi:hypothetical protein